jgi:phenylalanyl-tRNA synthetase beta chain
LDFVDLKGAIEAVVPGPVAFRRSQHRDLSLATEVLLEEQPIGVAGQLSGRHASALDASGAVLVAELDLDPIAQRQSRAQLFSEIERFPAVTRDIAMIVPEKVTHQEIIAVIETPREELLESVRLFDLFAGGQANNLGPAHKSLAYRLTYRDRNRTLTGEEVTAAHARVRARLQNELGAELRE